MQVVQVEKRKKKKKESCEHGIITPSRRAKQQRCRKLRSDATERNYQRVISLSKKLGPKKLKRTLRALPFFRLLQRL